MWVCDGGQPIRVQQGASEASPMLVLSRVNKKKGNVTIIVLLCSQLAELQGCESADLANSVGRG